MWISMTLVLLGIASFLAGKALFDRHGNAMRRATEPGARNFIWQLAGATSVGIGIFLSLGRQAAEPQAGTVVFILALAALAVFFLASFGQTLSRSRAG